MKKKDAQLTLKLKGTVSEGQTLLLPNFLFISRKVTRVGNLLEIIRGIKSPYKISK